MPASRPTSRDEFEAAIICALPLEYDAVDAVFDEVWDEDIDPYGRADGDLNRYTTGRIGNCNAIIVLLPGMGKASSASTAATMRTSYGNLRLVLVVGVCGGAPQGPEIEIVLGDVIISKTVVQYDLGRQYADEFVSKDTIEDSLGRPSKEIRNLIATFQTARGIDKLEDRAADFLQQLQAKIDQTKRRGKYKYPGTAADRLFKKEYRHKHQESPECICRDWRTDADHVCDKSVKESCADLKCDEGQLCKRKALDLKKELEQQDDKKAQNPSVHVGVVASGDRVLKSAAHRDSITKKTGAIGFEMEGAGVWDELPTIVVKGVCDYADSHKSKGWQIFAAATAAAAAKALLEEYNRPGNSSVSTKTNDAASGGRNPSAQDAAPALNAAQQPQGAVSPGGAAFYGPISGHTVIAGSHVTGSGTTNYNFG